MKKIKAIILASLLLTSTALFAEDKEKDNSHSFAHAALMYLPNRVLDVLDIFRCRVRVGPGFAVGVRATELGSLYLGSYASVYAGLPGPRGEPFPSLPVGLESHNGMEVSVVDATIDGGFGPGYSSTEFGFGGQLGIIGVDVGFDPVELLDFVTGIVGIDLRDDSL